MKCPHCGALMKDEQVFCESCGKERQLVPVFDAQIDATLQSTISGIVDDLANTKEIKPALVRSELEKQTKTQQLNNALQESATHTDTAKSESENENKSIRGDRSTETVNPDKKKKEYRRRDTETKVKTGKTGFVLSVVGGIFAVVILIIAIVVATTQYNNNSYEYQLQKAEEMYAASDYEQMLIFAKKASELAENSSDAKMMMARAYEGLGNARSKKQILQILLEADPAYVSAYDLLIPMLQEENAYEQIGQLLLKCSEQSVLDKYVEFSIEPPYFSEESGTFDDVSSLSVKLLASGSGEIFYTRNGSDPVSHGREYMTPIILSQGHHELKAVYRNQYGVYSEVVSASFDVQGSEMDQPLLSLESGVYDSPQYVTILNADELDAVYYTTDGSEPDTNSLLYTKPIPIPLGESHFIFVAYEEDMQMSEYTYADYTLSLDLSISGQQAANILVQAQIAAGVLTGHDGSLPDMEGRKSYEVCSVISENEMLYYLLAESYTSPDGDIQKTGNMFAVSVVTGESFTAVQNEMGTFDLHKIR